MLCYIWSYRHSAWWRTERSGYTDKLEDAGQYDEKDSAEIVLHALPGANVAVDTYLGHKFSGGSAEFVENLLSEMRRI